MTSSLGRDRAGWGQLLLGVTALHDQTTQVASTKLLSPQQLQQSKEVESKIPTSMAAIVCFQVVRMSMCHNWLW